MCDVFSYTTLTVCHNRPLLRFGCMYIYLQLNVEVWVWLGVCRRGGSVWDGWRCVGGVEECGGRVEVCGRGGGMWWEG